MNNRFIPYGRHNIDEADIKAVINVLKSGWITSGPTIEAFEKKLALFAGTQYAVAVSSGTAALHCAYAACGIGPGDEVIVPAITFVATANAAVSLGAIPVLADVDPQSLLIDPKDVSQKITPRTKAIVTVDYAGQPCDYDVLRQIADAHGLYLIADSCHSLGALYKDRTVAQYAHMAVYSFHPVKHITTGEGGAVVTNNELAANKMRCLRNHGIDMDFKARDRANSHSYDMKMLGWNYRITDFQCALGISQMGKLDEWLKKRISLAARYDEALKGIDGISPLKSHPDRRHAYHLYVIKVKKSINRDQVFTYLRERGIGVNVHYKPINLHSYYQKRFNMGPGLVPVSEKCYGEIITLPLHPALSIEEQDYILENLHQTIVALSK